MDSDMDKKRLERVKTLISEKGIDVTRMYNYDRKIQFIIEDGYSTKDSVIVSTIRTFCTLGDKEHEFNNKSGKDISDFTAKEITNLLKNVGSQNSTFSVKKSLIKKYMRWCYDSKIIHDSQIVRDIEEIKNDIIDKKSVYQKLFFDSYDSLKSAIIEKLTLTGKGINDKSLYAPYVVAEYLLWYGVRSEDVVEITKSDISINGDNVKIKTNSQLITIDNEDIAFYIDMCLKDDSYCKGDYLIRTQRKDKITFEKLSSWASKYFGESKGNIETRVIQYSKVYLSGQFDRAYKRECDEKMSYHYTDPRVSEMFEVEAGTTSAFSKLNEYYDYCDYFHSDRIKYPNYKQIVEYNK